MKMAYPCANRDKPDESRALKTLLVLYPMGSVLTTKKRGRNREVGSQSGEHVNTVVR